VPAKGEDAEHYLSTDSLSRNRFFDQRRILIAGYIGEPARNQAIVTHDGGATWKRERPPSSLR